MGLRERFFAEGVGFFTSGRLALGFVSAGYQFDPVPAPAWSTTQLSAEVEVEWRAPTSTSLDGVNLLEAGQFVEYVPFVDADGAADFVRLLRGMVLVYRFVFTEGALTVVPVAS